MSEVRRIGLVGFGSIAEHGHLPAWQSFPDVEIVGIADISPTRLDRARELLPSIQLYDSPRELIEQSHADVVDICTPPNTHAELILAACARGLSDIVCEKPLVLSEDDYVRVARARMASGSRVISVNNWAHSDLNRHISGALRAGAIGPVQSIDLRIGRPDCAQGSDGWNPRWRTDLVHAGGGIILDHGWHQLYLLMGWMREPLESISARTRTADSRHYPVEDEAQIDLLFSTGRGRIELSWTADGRTNEGSIRGDSGTITALDDCVVVENGKGRHELPFASRLSQSSYHPDWFEAVFQDNVLDDNKQEADRNFAEAGVLISAIRAAYRSASERGAPCRPVFTTRELAGSAPANRTDTENELSSRGGISA
jgi:predicted dehydrogenase